MPHHFKGQKSRRPIILRGIKTHRPIILRGKKTHRPRQVVYNKTIKSYEGRREQKREQVNDLIMNAMNLKGTI